MRNCLIGARNSLFFPAKQGNLAETGSRLNAIQVVEELMQDATVPPSVRLDAAREFLDRTVGKPAIRAEIAALRPQTNDRAICRQIDEMKATIGQNEGA